MKIYELNLHLPTSINEKDREIIWQKIKDLLKKTKSEVIEEIAFKQCELSYPIKKEKYSFFASLYFNGLPESILELQKFFDSERKILRHMVVTHREVPKKHIVKKYPKKLDKTTSVDNKIDKITKISTKKIVKKDSGNLENKIKQTDKKQSEPNKSDSKKKVINKKPKKEPKIKLEDIDKSLEKLLEKEL